MTCHVILKTHVINRKQVFLSRLNDEIKKTFFCGTSLVVQWLKLSFNTGDASSNPGRGTKITYATGQLSLCSGAHLPQLEKSLGGTTDSPYGTKTQRSQINKKFIFNFATECCPKPEKDTIADVLSSCLKTKGPSWKNYVSICAENVPIAGSM